MKSKDYYCIRLKRPLLISLQGRINLSSDTIEKNITVSVYFICISCGACGNVKLMFCLIKFGSIKNEKMGRMNVIVVSVSK